MVKVLGELFNDKNIERVFGQFGGMSIEWYFILVSVGLCIVGVIFLFNRFLGYRDIRCRNLISGILTVLYLAFILEVTLFCRENGSRSGIVLKPFSEFKGVKNDYQWVLILYAALNVLLFVPYGIAVSMYTWLEQKSVYMKIVWCAMIGFLTSLCIEVIQLLSGRGFYEVEDLVCNTIGCIVGGMMFCMLSKLLRLNKK